MGGYASGLTIVGSGIGSLTALLQRQTAAELFPDLAFPSTHTTPVLQAAFVFSLLSQVKGGGKRC